MLIKIELFPLMSKESGGHAGGGHTGGGHAGGGHAGGGHTGGGHAGGGHTGGGHTGGGHTGGGHAGGGHAGGGHAGGGHTGGGHTGGGHTGGGHTGGGHTGGGHTGGGHIGGDHAGGGHTGESKPGSGAGNKPTPVGKPADPNSGPGWGKTHVPGGPKTPGGRDIHHYDPDKFGHGKDNTPHNHGGSGGKENNATNPSENKDKLTDEEFEDYLPNIIGNEAKIPHLYLDSEGNVTIGIGTLVPDKSFAENLPLTKPDGKSATKEEKAKAYDDVKNFEKGNYNKFGAKHYAKATNLSISEDNMKNLVRDHMDVDRKGLRKLYSGFDSFSKDRKKALQDMAYQLGVGSSKNKNGLHGYQKMNEAIRKGDWTKAAAESNRSAANKERNEKTKNLLLSDK